MANMSYCRFRNTLEDLRDCHYNMEEPQIEEEKTARMRLLDLCAKIAADYEDEIEEYRESRKKTLENKAKVG